MYSLTKHQIISALLTGGALRIPHASNLLDYSFSIVNGVAREDGSNRSYNITGLSARTGKEQTVHVRTID